MTTIEEFNNLLLDYENTTLEFKVDLGEGDEKDRELKTMSAFYNTNGGKIIYGVQEDGKNRKIVGISRPSQILENNLNSKIRAKCNFNPFPTIEFITMGGHDCVIVHCPKGEQPPYTYNNDSYIRKGSTSIKATNDELAELHRKNSNAYDRTLVIQASIDDLDIEELRKYIEKREKDQILDSDFENLIIRMGFVGKSSDSKECKPTIAGLLLFGKSPQNVFPNAKIRAEAKFDDSNEGWDDIAEITGNIFEQIKSFDQFVKRNIKVSAKIIGFERVELPEIPIEALREAIMNAVTHRDYGIRGSEIHFRIHGDKILVDSPGGLIAPLTVPVILEGNYIPKTRNPIIASVLSELGFIDKRGTGFLRMKSLMKKLGLDEPSFSELQDGSGFRVSFQKNKSFFSNSDSFYIPSDILDAAKLSKEDSKILDFIANNKQIKSTECAKLLSNAKATAIKKLDSLVERKLLRKKSSSATDPNTAYVFNEELSPKKEKLSTDNDDIKSRTGSLF